MKHLISPYARGQPICFKNKTNKKKTFQQWKVLNLAGYYSIKTVLALVSIASCFRTCRVLVKGSHGCGCVDPQKAKVASGVYRASTPKPCSSKRIVHSIFYSCAKSHNNTAFTFLMRHVSSHYLVTVLLRTLAQQRCLSAFVLLSLWLHPKASWQSQDPKSRLSRSQPVHGVAEMP